MNRVIKEHVIHRGHNDVFTGMFCCRYESRFTILPDARAVACAEALIRAIACQPEEPYPAPSGNFVPLGDRI